MAKIAWDKAGTKYFEMGVRKGVLYPCTGANGAYGTGVPWNGLTGVTETPGGADETKLYADDIVYGSVRAAETLGGTIEAYTYPDEWATCDGSTFVNDSKSNAIKGVTIGQQKRTPFGLAFVTQIDNDQHVEGYKLHLIWNATASPSDRSYTTIGDSQDAINLSWEFSTTATPIDNFKAGATTSLITIDTTKLTETQKTILTTLEDKLYGTDETEPELPTPDEVIAMFAAAK